MELVVSLCDPGSLSVFMENMCEGGKTVWNRDRWVEKMVWQGGRQNVHFYTWYSYLVGFPDPNQLRGSRRLQLADAPVQNYENFQTDTIYDDVMSAN